MVNFIFEEIEESNLEQELNKIYEVANSELISMALNEMLEHRKWVKENFVKISKKLNYDFSIDSENEFKIFNEHDSTKISGNLLIPYSFLIYRKNLEYGVKMDINEDLINSLNQELITQLINSATLKHIISEPHHPEYWDPTLVENPLNLKDRDEGTKPIYVFRMPQFRIVEMICDWEAVNKKLNLKTNKKWYLTDWMNKVLNKRWIFNEKDTDTIKTLVKIFEEIRDY